MSGTAGPSQPRAPALLFVLVLATLTFQLCSSLINPLLVVVAREFEVSLVAVSIVSSAYFASNAIGGLVLARWSDSVGLRTALIVTLGAVLAGTLLCAVAASFAVLIAGRVLQGLGAAVYPLSALALREFLPPQSFGMAIGVLGVCNGGIFGLDGVIAGLIESHFGLRAVFWFLAGALMIAFAAVVLTIPRGRAGRQRMDWLGAATMSVVVVALLRLVSTSAEGNFRETLVWLLVLAAGIWATWAAQQRSPDPLIPLPGLRSPGFWPVLMVTFLSLVALAPVVTYSVALLVQDPTAGFGLTPTFAALWFLAPYALTGVVTAPAAGWCGARYGWVPVLRVGLLAGTSAALLLAFGFGSLPLVIAASAISGAATNGIVLPCVSSLSVLQSPPSAPASLPALNSAAIGIGISAGIALVAPQVARAATNGAAAPFAICGIVGLVALGATFLLRRTGAASVG